MGEVAVVGRGVVCGTVSHAAVRYGIAKSAIGALVEAGQFRPVEVELVLGDISDASVIAISDTGFEGGGNINFFILAARAVYFA